MRSCGVLLHISSLPGMGGCGSLGKEARNFVDFLANSGQSWWQMLPLTPPAQGNSPYSSYSVFAGNPAFISLESLEQEGVLPMWTRRFLPRRNGERVNHGFYERIQLPLLRQAFRNSAEKQRVECEQFRQRNAFWLDDYALFMAVKQRKNNAPLQQWPAPLLHRAALNELRAELSPEIEFWVWAQFQFFKQWDALKEYANNKGVGIIGDMPLYPNLDSADVWAHPEVFQLDAQLLPQLVAGVPPDDYSADGQLWGNPLYNWELLQNDGFGWWMERLAHSSAMYDAVRIDHFRGLDEYYAIPAGAATARDGVWKPGPGIRFVEAARARVPDCKFIAEDLGAATERLTRLLEDTGLAGMRVMQFGFDPDSDSPHLPHHYPQNCVAYTGTHDNDTIAGWVQSVPFRQLHFAQQYLRLSRREGYHWGFIRSLYASAADTVIVPMQDFLGLGSSARMNIPGQPEGNWSWRLNHKHLTYSLAVQMRELAWLYRRIPSSPPFSGRLDSTVSSQPESERPL